MALQMRVYAEIASVEAKVMWGMGWRQLAASWRPKGLKPERYLGYMLRQRFGRNIHTLENLEPAKWPAKPSLRERALRRGAGRSKHGR